MIEPRLSITLDEAMAKARRERALAFRNFLSALFTKKPARKADYCQA